MADVTLVGGAKREVHVKLDRDKLAARGLTSLSIVQAIQEGVRTITRAHVRADGTEYAVKFDGEFAGVAAIGNLEVAGQDGQRCYINDLGTVEMTTEELREAAFLDGKSAIAIRLSNAPEPTPSTSWKRPQKAVARLNETLPGGMKLEWVTDDGTFTKAVVDSAWSDILQGIGLTALILFLFLYNIRTTFIVAVTMPLTLIIGLFFIQMLGYTLNVMTLLSLGLSVGILVTKLDRRPRIHRRPSRKRPAPKEAARLGAKEVFIAVLASATTNMVVLFPLSVMHSMVGLFIAPFTWTMLIVTVVSLFISFSLTPLLASLLLKPHQPQRAQPPRLHATRLEQGFDAIVAGYRACLTFLEHYRWAAILLVLFIAGLFLQTMASAKHLGGSLGEDPDSGEVYVKAEFPTFYDLDSTKQRMVEMESLLKEVPHLRHFITRIGKVDSGFGQSSRSVTSPRSCCVSTNAPNTKPLTN